MAAPTKSAWDMDWMGDKLFGTDTDKLFAYQTPRIVKVNDRALGFIKYVFMLAIVCYIFVFNIWYKGTHFQMSPVEGIVRLQWQEPTNSCNPYKIECEANYRGASMLPYCEQYKGSEPQTKVVKRCDYYDARELPIQLDSGILLPTYIAKYRQTRACSPGAPTCATKWKYVNEDGSVQTGTGYGDALHQTFVSDAEDFTLLLDHSFRTQNGQDAASDNMMSGFWKPCADCKPERIKCVGGACGQVKHAGKHKKGDLASLLGFRSRAKKPWGYQRQSNHGDVAERLAVDSDLGAAGLQDGEEGGFMDAMSLKAVAKLQQSDQPQAIRIKDGDVFSLKTLLSMAGKALDPPWKPEDGYLPWYSLRLRGIALVVTIRYENLERWTLFKPEDPPWYTISVDAMPADTFKDTVVSQVDANTRDFTLNYGTMVVVKQTGTLAFFSLPFALISLTSAVALLAVSTTVTEFLMLNVLPRKDAYQVLKYKESQDFHPDNEKPTSKDLGSA